MKEIDEVKDLKLQQEKHRKELAENRAKIKERMIIITVQLSLINCKKFLIPSNIVYFLSYLTETISIESLNTTGSRNNFIAFCSGF